MGHWDRKELFATCSAGMCNRLMLLAGALRIAELTRRKLSLYWPVNQALGCRFERLFANLFPMLTEKDLHLLLDTGLTLKTYNAWHLEPTTWKVAADGDPSANIVLLKGWSYPMLTTDRHGPELEYDLRQRLRAFTPIPEIQAAVAAFPLPPRCLGVHVRRGDNHENFARSRDEHFAAIMRGVLAREPETHFFFATSVKETEERFRREFGDRLLCYPKSTASRQEERGGQEALIDLLLLSRAAAVLGNVDSSYSSTAARLGGKPFAIADENSADKNLARTCSFLAGCPSPPAGSRHPLDQFQGTPAARRVETLWVVGAHRFEERVPLCRTFPELKHIYLFEPLPEPCAAMRSGLAGDPRVRVFECALADSDGMADFNLSNNALSSSLLPLGRHAEFWPHVHYVRTIRVPVRTARTLLESDGLRPPDLLFMDTQGAELKVLAGMPAAVLDAIGIIFTEASLEELYTGSGVFRDIQTFLGSRFECRGFWPMELCPCHGNALFVNRSSPLFGEAPRQTTPPPVPVAQRETAAPDGAVSISDNSGA